MTVDLATSYLGLKLSHPVVPSASPLTADLDHLHALVEAGAAAVVLPSLFEEQLEHDAMAIFHGETWSAGSFAEATDGFWPEMETYNTGPGPYLDLIRAAKRELAVPVIASLNGTSRGGWTLYAKVLEDAGIDALELNIYLIAADPAVSSLEVEARYLDLVESVRNATNVALAVKLGPFFSSMAHMANRLVEAGADGLVLFNRFYQPDIDLDRMEVVPNLVLSSAAELRLVLRWMAILHDRVGCSLAATTGVEGPDEAIKLILAGADVTMMASALLRHGPSRLRETVDGLRSWLDERGYTSLEQAKGSLSQKAVPDPTAYERSNYMQTLVSYSPPW